MRHSRIKYCKSNESISFEKMIFSSRGKCAFFALKIISIFLILLLTFISWTTLYSTQYVCRFLVRYLHFPKHSYKGNRQRNKPFACSFHHNILQTSIHFIKPEHSSNSSKESSIALFGLPHAGNTVLKRLSDTSKYVSTPTFIAKGQTPPIVCPTKGSASSKDNIFAFVSNRALYLALSILASPGATINITSSSI